MGQAELVEPAPLLAIETATDLVGAAVLGSDGLVAEARTIGRRRHAECLAPAIRHVTEQAGLPLDALVAVGVDVGPGLFTGLRVGVATANGLATGLGIPVVGMSSLAVLDAGARAAASGGGDTLTGASGSGGPDASGTVLAVVDARRGQLFVGSFRHGEPLAPPALVDPDALPSVVAACRGASGLGAAAPVLAVGDGAQRYRAALTAIAGVTVAGPGLVHPTPGDLARLVARRLADDPAAGVVPPVLPQYLRGADVRVGWTSRPVPAGG